MNSTGNDIVALKIIDRQRSNQSRFYSRILSASELELYEKRQFEMSFEMYLWLLWSVKESVFKHRKRADPGLFFSPTKIIIQSIAPPSGPSMIKFEGGQWESDGQDERQFYRAIILAGSGTFYSRSMVSSELITTVAAAGNDFEGIFWGIGSIDRSGYDYQSLSARNLLLNKLKAFFPGNDWQIVKNPAGCPTAVRGENEIPVSLAHHDRFIAYSFVQDAALSGAGNA